MTFLKKFGAIVLKGMAIAAGLQPLIGTGSQKAGYLTGQVVDTLGQVAVIVGQVEVFGQVLGTKGEDKLKAATPAVQQILLSSLVAGKKIKDPQLFKSGSTKVTDGVAEILNSLDENSAKEEKP